MALLFPVSIYANTIDHSNEFTSSEINGNTYYSIESIDNGFNKSKKEILVIYKKKDSTNINLLLTTFGTKCQSTIAEINRKEIETSNYENHNTCRYSINTKNKKTVKNEFLINNKVKIHLIKDGYISKTIIFNTKNSISAFKYIK